MSLLKNWKSDTLLDLPLWRVDSDLSLIWDPQRFELAHFSDSMIGRNQNNVGSGDKYPTLLIEDLKIWKMQPSMVQESDDSYLRAITVNVTQVCNLKCLYCEAGGDGTYGAPQKKIDIQRVIPSLHKALSLVKPNGQLRVTFSGGEPLLYPEGILLLAQELTELSNKNNFKIRFGIVTNATLFNQSNIYILKKYKMDVTLSLDGDPEQNAAMRPSAVKGVDLQKKINSGLELLRKNKKDLGSLLVSGVFSSANSDLLRAYQYYQSLDVDYFEFNYDIKNRDQTEEDINFNLHYIKSLEQIANDLFNKQGEAGVRKILLFDRYFDQLDKRYYLKHHCGGGKSYLSVSSNGDLYSCPWLNGSSEKINNLSESNLIGHNRKLNCQTCWAKGLCGGGCAYIHRTHQNMDSKNEGEPAFCDRTKSLIKLAFMYYVKGRTFYEKQLSKNVHSDFKDFSGQKNEASFDI